MQMPLVTIISTNPIIVTADVNVRQLMLLQGLEEVEVEIPDLGRTYTARVTYLSPIANTGGFYTMKPSWRIQTMRSARPGQQDHPR